MSFGWPPKRAVFRYVAETNAALAERLRVRFFELALAELWSEEVAYFVDAPPPVFEVSDEVDGQRYVRLRYCGVTVDSEWDGTDGELIALVESWAPNVAANIAEGYWEVGGWRTKASYDDES